MDFQRPLSVITPTLDGDLLAILGATEVSLTGRELARRTLASQEGVRAALDRLVRQGVVLRERAGAAFLFRLNRLHLAAPYIEGLATLRLELIRRARQAIVEWKPPAKWAVLFGSVARGEAGLASDIDFLVVREDHCDADDLKWRKQLDRLQMETASWTGNEARILEYSAEEFSALFGKEPVLRRAASEGIVLFGSLPQIKRRSPVKS